MESGLKETLVNSSNYVPVKGVVEYFDNILLQNKRKGVEGDFCFQEAITFISNIKLGKDYSHWKDDSEENNMEFLYMENDNTFLHELRRKRTCNIVWQFFLIICVILTKWLLAHFVELGGVNTSVQFKNAYSRNGRGRGSLQP
jgi:hypothetical protein